MELHAGLASELPAAHYWLLQALKVHRHSFPRIVTILDRNLQRSLGEFIAFFIGVNHDYAGARAFAAHALSPLAAIPKSEIDITSMPHPKETSPCFKK